LSFWWHCLVVDVAKPPASRHVRHREPRPRCRCKWVAI